MTETRRANSQTTQIQVQNRIAFVMSLKYTPVAKSILIFLVCVRFTQHLNHGGQESEKQFAVYDSDTPVTLKQG